ncbi:UNVERIFIED_CONTAM: hypothetical protein HDU68_002619, partial [Siphonaria sp. JEL0065]
MIFLTVLGIAGLATATYIPPQMIHLKGDTSAPAQQPEQPPIDIDMAQARANGVAGWNDDTQSSGEIGDLCNAQKAKRSD